MNKHFSQIFITNIKELRVSLKITEAGMDYLLKKYNLIYTGNEKQSKGSISLDLAKRVSDLFGKDIEYFLNKDSVLISEDNLPTETQFFLTNTLPYMLNAEQDKDEKLSIYAYTIVYLKYYNNNKTKFVNSEILPFLPAPLNKSTSIDWSGGLLKGLATNTKTYKKNPLIPDPRNRGEAYYQLNGPIPTETVDKALKKVNIALLEKAINLALKKMEEKEE